MQIPNGSSPAEGQVGLTRSTLVALMAVVLAGTGIGLAITAPPMAWLPMVAALPFLTYPVPRLEPLWTEWGAVYGNVWTALLVHATGGIESDATVIFSINVAFIALTRPLRVQVRAVVSAWLCGGAVAAYPVLESGEPLGDPTQLLAVLASATLIALFTGHVVGRGRAADTRLRGVLQQSGELIYQAHRTPFRMVGAVGGALASITGLPEDELLEQPDLFHERMHPKDHERIVLSPTDDVPDRYELVYRWHHGDGTWHWFEDHLVVLERDTDGRATLVQGSVRDITHTKETTQALERALTAEREATGRLERVDGLRTTFLQAVSHELRTPLTAIVGFSETLGRRPDRPPSDRLLIARIRENGHQLMRLLDDLLDVDRLTRSPDVVVRRPTDVADLVREVLRSTDLEGRTTAYQGSGHVIAELDSIRFERIVSNLVRNAVRHTPYASHIDVHLVVAGTDLELVVADDGPGVADADRERIFGTFEQGDDATKAPSPGTGIGLALVREFANAHGGRAWVDRSPLGGAAFHVLLPGCIREHEPTEATVTVAIPEAEPRVRHPLS